MKILTSNPRVILKKFSFGDSNAIFSLIDGSREHLSQRGDETASKYKTLEDVANSITNPPNPNKLRMGIWDNSKLVGSINLIPSEDRIRAEIGYYLGANSTGKGYATLATVALTNYAFGNGFEEVFAKVEFDNDASVKVLKKAGYTEITKERSEKRIFSKKAKK